MTIFQIGGSLKLKKDKSHIVIHMAKLRKSIFVDFEIILVLT